VEGATSYRLAASGVVTSICSNALVTRMLRAIRELAWHVREWKLEYFALRFI
jgi:hypothetical protein